MQSNITQVKVKAVFDWFVFFLSERITVLRSYSDLLAEDVKVNSLSK